MEQRLNYNEFNEPEEDLKANFKNIFLAIWNRKFFIAKVFTITLLVFIAMAFILPKQWKVQADLYINKTNNSNLLETNPYAIEEAGNMYGLLGANNSLSNEIEIMQSPRVIDKVVRENNLKYEKIFDIIPTPKVGEYWTTEKFLKKDVKFENIKGTNIVSVSFKCKYRDKSYNIVKSLVNNYIKLHQEINSEKSKSDKAILQSEYEKAKADLNKKVNSSGGLPATSFTGAGNLTAMSMFSRSAQNAISNIQGQYIAGEKSRIDVSESAAKVSQLASKLEWANLVEEMSDSSKVILLREPYQLRDWEYDSPKPLICTILGIVFGIIFSIFAVIYKELTDKKLAYTMLGDNVIYDLNKEFNKLSAEFISNSDGKTALAYFEDLSSDITDKFKIFGVVPAIKAEISPSFKTSMKNIDNVILFESINKTNTEDYRLVKHILESMNKKIIYEVLTK